MKRKSGWFFESRRHSLASRGVKTAQKVPKMAKPKYDSWENKIKNAKTKGDARQVGIDFQDWVSNQNLSFGELIFYQNLLNPMAKKFGLIQEFRENGLI